STPKPPASGHLLPPSDPASGSSTPQPPSSPPPPPRRPSAPLHQLPVSQPSPTIAGVAAGGGGGDDGEEEEDTAGVVAGGGAGGGDDDGEEEEDDDFAGFPSPAVTRVSGGAASVASGGVEGGSGGSASEDTSPASAMRDAPVIQKIVSSSETPSVTSSEFAELQRVADRNDNRGRDPSFRPGRRRF
ncbi:MAG: hypothetical protein Q9218_007007, partial [Villophora microphyllina]